MKIRKFAVSLERAARRALRLRAGRALTVRDDDIYVVSYPKSGNTWTRFLVGNLLSPDEPVTFSNVEAKVPDIYQHSDRTLLGLPAPRVLKSHEYFDPRYRRVVCIVRDPRAVAISYFHFLVKMRLVSADASLLEFVGRFVRGELDSYGSWAENVGSWLGARDSTDGFLLLRYEDMLQDPAAALGRISSLIGGTLAPAEAERAIARSSFKEMQSLEQKSEGAWQALKDSRADKPFMRRGEAEAWRTELPAPAIAIIEERWGPLMSRIGYELTGQRTVRANG